LVRQLTKCLLILAHTFIKPIPDGLIIRSKAGCEVGIIGIYINIKKITENFNR